MPKMPASVRHKRGVQKLRGKTVPKYGVYDIGRGGHQLGRLLNLCPTECSVSNTANATGCTSSRNLP